ncbi:MAG TPA: SusE domain-containing protein [Mucilaginibacter sp.]
MMKTVLTKLFAFGSVALLMLSACKKNDAIVTSNGGKAGSLTASTTTPTLDKTKLTDTTKVINFSFTNANYGFSAAVANTLQIDAASDNWANPTSVTFGNKINSQGYTTAAFNNLLLKLNLPAGKAAQVVVRIAHTISASVAPVYSNVLTLTATPFNLTSYLYVTGAAFGWENPGPLEDSLVSVTGNGVYVGIFNFTAGNNQFLILPAKKWDHKYATNNPTTQVPSTTVTYDASNNLNAPAAAGQYIVTFNLNTGTISFELANFYSIIGDAAQGWGTDVQMKFVNDGNNNWVATLPLASTGSFKVRQNDDWTYSWGIPKAGSAGDGVAATLNDTSNNNISVASTGTHTVIFSIPITAVGTTPPVTATYSVN